MLWIWPHVDKLNRFFWLLFSLCFFWLLFSLLDSGKINWKKKSPEIHRTGSNQVGYGMIKQLSKMQLIFKTQCLMNKCVCETHKKSAYFVNWGSARLNSVMPKAFTNEKNVQNRCYFCEILNHFYWKHFFAKMTWAFMYQFEEHFSRFNLLTPLRFVCSNLSLYEIGSCALFICFAMLLMGA